MSAEVISNLGVAFAVYIVGTASPGPANLSIANTALRHGRKPGFAMAAGVICGSLCWGVTAAAGMSALLMSYRQWLIGLKVLGALYLLWLAYKTTRGALAPLEPSAAAPAAAPVRRDRLLRFYLQGLGIHLTNPKAILSWLTVTSLGLSPHAPAWTSFVLVGCCALLGASIFLGYAVAFSARAAGPFFARTRKAFGLFCGGFYCVLAAGFLRSIRS